LRHHQHSDSHAPTMTVRWSAERLEVEATVGDTVLLDISDSDNKYNSSNKLSHSKPSRESSFLLPSFIFRHERTKAEWTELVSHDLHP